MTNRTGHRFRKNKANFWGKGSGATDRGSAGLAVPPMGPVVQTKPISGGWARTSPGPQRRAGCRAGTKRAKQSQLRPDVQKRARTRKGAPCRDRLCETKPIQPEHKCRTSILWKRSYDEPGFQRALEKQSQFQKESHPKPERPASSPPGLPTSHVQLPPDRLAAALRTWRTVGSVPAKQSQFLGLVQDRVTLFAGRSPSGESVNYCGKRLYSNHGLDCESSECYPGPNSIEPGQFLPSTTMGQLFCGRGVTTNRAPDGPWKNKANFGRSFKSELSSVKTGKIMVVASNLTLYPSHSAEGRSCETKPIPGNPGPRTGIVPCPGAVVC